MRYAIDKKFKHLRYIHMPKNKPVLALENVIIQALYYCQPLRKTVTRTKIIIPTRGHALIKLDVFVPKNKTPRGFMLYLPGGGFVMKASHYHKQNVMEMVEKTEIAMGLLHYRLAPKHPFPTAFYDCLDAMDAIFNDESLKESIEKGFLIGGDSAGGNLAMGAALYQNDHPSLSVLGIMLIYPGVTDGISTESRKNYTDVPMFNASMLPYLDKWVYPKGVGELHSYAFPYHHPHLMSLPKVYIETAEFDCLHDEGIAFAHRLMEAGNSVVLNETKGTVHGYDVVKNAEQTQLSKQQRMEFIKSCLFHSQR
jgi:acetyl esterase/lipase